ncbi:uncharacterized protein [Amphiura filiformis]|uniref:uncharacterized protein n=1 Tax=Amphiura filiformis TaxID=82378 RepID=UPI003B2116EC
MELHYIVWIIAMICRVQSVSYRNVMSETDEQRCEAICEDCFKNTDDSLKRMGCLEKCIAEGVDQFTCPGSQSFLSAVSKPSTSLATEINDFFVTESALVSARDFKGLEALFTEDSIIIVADQKPVIGPVARAHEFRDYLIANPDIDHSRFDPVDFGEENGLIWANIIHTDYNKQDVKPISSMRHMVILRRVGTKLQESAIATFQ